jgi:hypothetical protein
MGAQTHKQIGIELLITAAIGTTIFLYGFRQAFRLESHPSKQRLVVGSCLYLAQLLGAVVLISGAIVGLYLAAVAMVLNIAFMISGAWLLVVGAYTASKAK